MELVADEPADRLDRWLSERIARLTRAQIQTIIRDGGVTIDGRPAKPAAKLKGRGERIRIVIPPPPPSELIPDALPLDVLYEEPSFAVINKPAGMIVHPGAGVERGTLANALLARYPELAQVKGQRRHGIVHRLDKMTSGAMVVARTEEALNALAKQFAGRTVSKQYVALLESAPKPDAGTIALPIARDPEHRTRMAVVRNGRSAVTHYRVVETFTGGYALVEARIETGRTHQIRVHFAHVGCPVVGDTTYGFRKPRIKLGRTFLHAARLAFDHPRDGRRLEFAAPLPDELERVLRRLRAP
ncbi:MAG: RluA family pseudouridine synthase [Chloroflexi bacterium]|nr:RluA family pseudouridine synthase [Chloroflexota bacterium]